MLVKPIGDAGCKKYLRGGIIRKYIYKIGRKYENCWNRGKNTGWFEQNKHFIYETAWFTRKWGCLKENCFVYANETSPGIKLDISI